MTPTLLQSLVDDCGVSHIMDSAVDFGDDLRKQRMEAAVADELLLHAPTPPDSFPEWSNAPSLLLNEASTSSALRSRLLQVEASPVIRQGTPSETFSSGNSISFRHHGEGAAIDSRVPPNPHVHSVQPSYPDTELDPSGDAMDTADVVSGLDDDDHWIAARIPPTTSMWEAERPCRPNPNSNHDMALFLTSWRSDYEYGNVLSPISGQVRDARQMQRSPIVSVDRVLDGNCDIQGINWHTFETNASEAQMIRRRYHQHPLIRQFPTPSDAQRLRAINRTFEFQQTNNVARPWIEHYQLRNLLATTSSNDIHYVSRSKVMSVGPSTLAPTCVMDLHSPNVGSSVTDFHITALANCGTTLVAGSFRGQFAIQNLLSEYGTEPVTGYISHHPNAMTNHIHGFNSRSNGCPLAVICSNDRYIRTLDLNTCSVASSALYDDVINCAAEAPNGRLRMVVGDFEGAMITDADSGRVLEHANGSSRGHGFACAWADNDIHCATAGQDCQVLVWDARNWSAPLSTIATENTYATSLRFSPVGGGSPLLIIAEAADTVSVVDARNFASKQNIDFFGDIAGMAISADGSQLFIGNGDRTFGGLMTFNRRDFGHADGGYGDYHRNSYHSGASRSIQSQQRSDWLPECELRSHPRVRMDAKARRRRGLRLDDIIF